jgi:hypothetical protein
LTTTALWLVFGGPVIAAIIWIVKARPAPEDEPRCLLQAICRY